MKIKVFIADDATFLVDAFNKCIQDIDDIVFAGSASNPDELRVRLSSKVDVLLLDFFPEKRDFIELVKEISEKYPLIRLLILSGRRREFHALSKEAIDAGAKGLISKSRTLPMILDSIRTVFLNPNWKIIEYDADPNEDSKIGVELREKLSKRELQVISLLCRGFRNNEEMADLLTRVNKKKIAEGTVQKHRANLMDKLRPYGVTNQVSLGFWVGKWNLLDGSELSSGHRA